MIGLIVYLAGIVVFTYPAYFRLVVAKKSAKKVSFLGDSGYFMLPIYATIIAAIWPILTPFYASYWLHTRCVPNFDEDKAKAIEFSKRQQHYERIRASVQADADFAMDRALRELYD